MNLDTPLSDLNGVGKTIGQRLKTLGLETVEDLLFYFPFRYENFSKTTKISELLPDTKTNIVGQIELIQNRRAHRRRMYLTEALISDKTCSLKVIWFNQPFIAKNLKIGDTVPLAGKIEDQGVLTMISPTYERINSAAPIHTLGFVPAYHLTEKITQKQLRLLIKQIIPLSKKFPTICPMK
jgi:ATP-dependent DNA helicase RecG